jgi:hypothetical protein
MRKLRISMAEYNKMLNDSTMDIEEIDKIAFRRDDAMDWKNDGGGVFYHVSVDEFNPGYIMEPRIPNWGAERACMTVGVFDGYIAGLFVTRKLEDAFGFVMEITRMKDARDVSIYEVEPLGDVYEGEDLGGLRNGHGWKEYFVTGGVRVVRRVPWFEVFKRMEFGYIVDLMLGSGALSGMLNMLFERTPSMVDAYKAREDAEMDELYSTPEE